MKKLRFFLIATMIAATAVFAAAQTAGDVDSSSPKKVFTGIREAPNGQEEGSGDVASSILIKANLAHGGAALDNLKTVAMKGKFSFAGNSQEFDVRLIADVTLQNLRYELSLNRRTINIFQLDSSGGWNWNGFAKVPLTKDQRRDLQIVFRSGFLGMRTGALNDVKILRVDSTVNPKRETVWMSFEGKVFNIIFDENFRILAEGAMETNNLALTTYDNFRVRSGIVIPFIESIANIPKDNPANITQGNKIRLTSVEINPSIDQSEWADPK